MPRWIYDLGFALFAVVSLPHFLGRLRQTRDPWQMVRERLGLFSPEKLSWRGKGRPIWIHAVSVGEALAIERFLKLLLERNPRQKVVLTTVTPTGHEMVKTWEGERVKVLYFPFDLGFAVARFFESFNPQLLLLVETEIWPNVLTEAKQRGVPVGVINGRISERSFQAFRRFAPLFRPLLAAVDFFLVQTEQDRNRLIELGVRPERVVVSGNMKLDAVCFDGRWETERETLRVGWQFGPQDQVLLGGSTHRGEEEILLRVLRVLREERFTQLKLILAPRHVERSREIVEQAKQENFRVILASEGEPHSSFDVLILDELGPLRKLYAVADVVVMGGSFVRHGGQNPVEPAAFRRALLHGPWVFNFEELYRRLDEAGGSLAVPGEEQLLFVLKQILPDEAKRRQLGERAFQVLEKLRGATERHLDLIEQFSNKPKGVHTHVR